MKVLEERPSLFEIREDVQQVSDAIAAVVKLDIVIYDDNMKIVAATGGPTRSTFWVEAGTNVCRETLNRAEPLVILDSGRNSLCRDCELAKNNSCGQTAEITYPLVYEGIPVGVISLTAFDEEQRDYLADNQAQFLTFLAKMSGLLTGKLLIDRLYRRSTYLAGQFETFINTVRDGIIAVDKTGAVVEFNPSAERIFGLEKAQVLGNSIASVMPESPMLDVLSTGKPFPEREVRQRLTGGRRQVSVVCTADPIIQHGVVVGAIGIFRDISEVRRLIHDLTERHRSYTFDDIVGESEVMQRVKDKARRVAASDSTVLIMGESGTGKELFARAIHAASCRARGPFKAVNCAAIPEPLLESELFGYDEGAFTGARRSGKPGKFELASGGTLFLDELGDMSLHLQAKLLRVLEEKRIERVGGTEPIDVDVRVIAATNRNLEEMIKAGEFRKDVFYRLNVIPLHIPPLSERDGDIDLFCDFFVRKYAGVMRKNITGLSAEARQVLHTYTWPGNVRELENAIEYAVNMETGPVIAPSNLPPRLSQQVEEKAAPVQTPIPTLAEAERNLILRAMRYCGSDYSGKREIARLLGIHVATLYRKIERYEIREAAAEPARRKMQ